MEHHTDRLLHQFTDQFGPCELIQQCQIPYRICPLGAHIDHQLGNVTGLAINRYVHFLFTPTENGSIEIHSHQFTPPVSFSINTVPSFEQSNWQNYIAGAVEALQQSYTLTRGIKGILTGAMPIGGLSSSAAVGIAYLLALEAANALQVDPWENIRLNQYIENTYIGLNNGILDQSMILLGNAHHILHLDCESNETQHVPISYLEDQTSFCIAYSGISKGLPGTSYNQRVEECRIAAAHLLEKQGDTQYPHKLRYVDPGVFEREKDSLPESVRKRALHFFSEMNRVEQSMEAHHQNDISRLGSLMNESGESSITNYECGSPQLIQLDAILKQTEGVWGARFSGAGFRGSCIALVDKSKESSIAEEVTQRYAYAYPDLQDAFQITFCNSSDGGKLL